MLRRMATNCHLTIGLEIVESLQYDALTFDNNLIENVDKAIMTLNPFHRLLVRKSSHSSVE